MRRCDHFVKAAQAEAGLSSPPESEDIDGEDEATRTPTLIMLDEATGNEHAMMADEIGPGKKGDLTWPMKDVHEELNSWGHPGGTRDQFKLKCDGGRALVALRKAVADIHGGCFPQSSFPRGSTPQTVPLKGR